ncbi:hypothetical protein [Mesorhizobium sp. M0701]|uniref:hypothetical protein n=1 Tax=Mesorhizobium sp. M0701 TaxID=2956989 RepID=UPI0033382984
MDYQLITQVNKMADVDLERLPFMKRWPYGDESEYRAVYIDNDKELAAYAVPIELNAITRVTLSPWLAPALVPVVKETLKSLPGCSGLRVDRSTLIDNEQWKKLTGRVTIPVMPSGS